MVNSNGQVSSIIIAPEFRGWHISLFEGATFWWWRLMLFLFLEGGRSSASCATELGMLLERPGHGEFLIGLVLFLLQFLLREVVRWEITEGRVRVLGCVLILPWFV